MKTCKQDSAGRAAYRCSGISIGKTHSFGSHFVQRRCLDHLLTVAAQVAVQIVADQEKDIRPSSVIVIAMCGTAAKRTQGEKHQQQGATAVTEIGLIQQLNDLRILCQPALEVIEAAELTLSDGRKIPVSISP